jgi:multimeric flavodoxin WrbA
MAAGVKYHLAALKSERIKIKKTWGDKSMKTLIFNGSPRKKGNTMSLVNELLKHLKGEHKLVDAYYCGIKPCIDCRYCWKNPGCSIKDGMTEIYDYIQEADNIIVASSLNFAELTGQLLSVLSRLQTYYCAETLRNETPIPKAKRGGIILVGGGDGTTTTAQKTAKLILKHMNAKEIAPPVISHNTDRVAAIDDTAAMSGIRELASFLNRD